MAIRHLQRQWRVWVYTQQLHSDKQAENSTVKLLTMPLDAGQINLFEGVATVALVVFAFPWSLRWKPLLAPFETAKAPEPNPSGFWLQRACSRGGRAR